MINYSITYFNFVASNILISKEISWLTRVEATPWPDEWLLKVFLYLFKVYLNELCLTSQKQPFSACLIHQLEHQKCHHFDFNILHLLFSLHWPFTQIGLLKDVLRMHWITEWWHFRYEYFIYSNLKVKMLFWENGEIENLNFQFCSKERGNEESFGLINFCLPLIKQTWKGYRELKSLSTLTPSNSSKIPINMKF